MLCSFKLEAAIVLSAFVKVFASSHVLFTERYRQQEANSWSVLQWRRKMFWDRGAGAEAAQRTSVEKKLIFFSVVKKLLS